MKSFKLLLCAIFIWFGKPLFAEDAKITPENWSDSTIFYLKTDLNKAIKCGKTGLQLAKTTSDTSMMGLLSSNLCTAYLISGKYDSAFYYASQAEYWFQFLENKSNLLWCKYFLGIIYEMKNQSDSAIQEYKAVLASEEVKKIPTLYISSLLNLGTAYFNKSMYHNALSVYSETLKMCRNFDTLSFINVSINMGGAYNTLLQYDSALFVLQEGLKYAEEGGFLLKKASLLTNLSDTWLGFDRYNDAQKNIEEAILIREEAEDSIGLAHSYRMMGKLLIKKKAYNHANDYYFKSIKIDEALKFPANIAASYCNIGECLHYQQDYQTALAYFDQAYDIASKIGAGQEMSASTLGKSFAWKALNEPEKSEKFMTRYLQIRDSLQKIDLLNVDDILSLKKSEDEAPSTTTHNYNIFIINILLSASLLLNLLFIYFIYARKKSKKPNDIS